MRIHSTRWETFYHSRWAHEVLNLKEVIFEEQPAGHLADLHRFAPASQHRWFAFKKYLQKVRDEVAF